MTFPELFIIAVGLSMDAFAVSICKGLAMNKITLGACSTVGLYFGGFQAAMPLIGYLLGARFAHYIEAYDHWIAFVLLVFIGARMFKESFDKDVEENGRISCEQALTPGKMLPLALATSIDALAIGVSFAFLRVDIVPAVSFIGVTTFVFSFVGVRLGAVLGIRFKSWAEKAGGIILILMGVKILLEHLGVIA